MNLKPSQIIAIGVAILFGLPIIVGLVVGQFYGLWWGVVAGGFTFLLIVFVAQRYTKRTQDQEKEDRDNHA